MRTVTLKTGEIVPATIFDDVMARLMKLDRNQPVDFCHLVRACRSPANYELKLCVFTPQKCRAKNHAGCRDTARYQELIVSIDDQAHAHFDPGVRAIILAAVEGLMLPRLVSPLA